MARAVWFALFALLLLFRLRMPFLRTDMMMTHSAIVQSLLAGHNWARQTLVGAVEFPVLSSLALLVAEFPARLLPCRPEVLLVAFCQVWALCYILRIPRKAVQRWVTGGVLSATLMIPEVLDAVLSLDPGWTAAVPVSAAIYHLDRWVANGDLRDGVLTSAAAGVLVFSGPVGLAFAVGLLFVMCCEVPSVGRRTDSAQGGIMWLIWAPLCYCLVLWLLWNRMIIGDAFFAVRPLFAFLSLKISAAEGGFFSASSFKLYWVALLGGGAMLAHIVLDRGGVGVCLLAALLSALVCSILVRTGGVVPAGAYVICFVAGISGLLLPFSSVYEPGEVAARAGVGVLALTGCLVVGRLAGRVSAEQGSVYLPGAPPRRAILSFVDQFWPDSRIFVYGVRVPSIYSDPEEDRFVSRLDCYEGEFLRQALDEQLHLLLPPAEGPFPTVKMGPLKEIYHGGRPWLLFEKSWPGGWQLWRCVIPPEGESKLMGIGSS